MALETTQAGTGLRDKEGWMETALGEVRVFGEGAVEAYGTKRGSGAASLAALHPGKSQRAVSSPSVELNFFFQARANSRNSYFHTNFDI